ncbi:PREDICTED: peptidyl-prolyl cis-trans isomerase D isoform X2 [Dinoponera quadriceps]|uniref:peptidylprolyl isomerase n=1 Tax=Dinoponera quadriceps TaxID=609295 RepID=A0A6P3YCD4_DINQU|nr:PREDICTED: peptidyl-prolyl cis-trans isomerase D isoform X2 [Dinoponera quadriceps]
MQGAGIRLLHKVAIEGNMKHPFNNDSHFSTNKNPIVFLDVVVGPEKVGRIVIELFKDIVPRTAENFRALCTGEKGGGVNAKRLHYKGCVFHKAIPQFMIQGGDIVNFNGTSGESIYGPYFEDENFHLKHTTPGLLSMVNEGKPNTNSSQFIITCVPCLHLDDTNVVFGKVIRGMGVVLELNSVSTVKDIPVDEVRIVNCGELKRNESWGMEENDGSEDVYTPWPEDWDYSSHVDKLSHRYVKEVIRKIKDSGNHYFSRNNFVDAGRKYKKALRYYNWMTKQADLSDTSDNTLINLKVIILLNLAAVKLRKRIYRDAMGHCNEVLKLDRANSKALFRRGQAYIGMNEYELGLADLQQALLECPNNKDIIQEINKIKKIMNSYLIREKASCQRMFKQ